MVDLEAVFIVRTWVAVGVFPIAAAVSATSLHLIYTRTVPWAMQIERASCFPAFC